MIESSASPNPHLSPTTVTEVANSRLSTPVPSTDQLLETSRDFSSLLIEQMLNAMRTTVHHQDNPLHGGLSQEIFEDFLYREYATMLAHSGNLGIDRLIYEQLR